MRTLAFNPSTLPSSRLPAGALQPALFAGVIAAGLAVDQRFQPWGQAAVDAAVWSLFLALVWQRHGAERLALLACLAYASAGELFLSEGLGLYTYRDGSIPLFVPPGHVLLLLLGMEVTRAIPKRILAIVPWATLPIVAAAAWTGIDPSAPYLFALYVVCLRFGPSPSLYSAMFVLSLAMEVYGVWLGNWTWTTERVFDGPRLHNPPLAAGAFYCVLDWLVIATRNRFYPSCPSSQSHAAPRTPLESPWAGEESRVSTRSEKT